MPIHILALVLTATLAACQTLPAADVANDPDAPAEPADVVLFSIEVERAYTLEDPRELDFKARIAAEAAQYCGTARHTIQSTRPYGPERIGEDFLYRMVDVGITCAP